MSEQKKHSLMMFKNNRPREQAKGVAVCLVDVLSVIAEKKLKAFTQCVCVGNYTLNAHHSSCCAFCHRMLSSLVARTGIEPVVSALRGRRVKPITLPGHDLQSITAPAKLETLPARHFCP